LQILLIEDNLELSNWLSKSLEGNHHEVECCNDGLLGLERLTSGIFDIVILDLKLPGMNGQSILRRVRALDIQTPILVLTANDSFYTKIDTLDFGADDFLAKPFELEELEARMRAIMRRQVHFKESQIICGDLKYDKQTKLFWSSDHALNLTPREHDVLEVLIKRQGQTLSKKQISDQLSTSDELVTDDAIEIYINRLRKKLESTNARIGTLRGLGYILNASHATQ